MNDKEKIQVMSSVVKPIVQLIEQRLGSRLDMLNTLAIQPIDGNLPESVKNKREDECSKIRAVVQEQRDLLSMIKALFPDVETPKSTPTKKVRVKKSTQKNG
jgi:hypothetical protein